MAIMHGYDVDGNFVAIDTATKAANRGYRFSSYWHDAKNDPETTAATMIADQLTFREMFPDMPSVQPDVWNANFFAMAQLIGR